MIWGLLLPSIPTGVFAGCPACQNLSVTNPCLNPPDMSAFWQNGQVPNDLGATFGDLHSTSNKSIVASGTTNGSVSFTFGMASQYVYADFNLYGSCNDRLGQNYDGVQLVVAAQSTGVTFDIKVQMFADDTCTVVDGAKDVIFHSADINMFTFANHASVFCAKMIPWCLVLCAARVTWAGCSVCQGLSIINSCVNPPNMATFWAEGQVPNDLGATFGDLHSVTNKFITTSGDPAGSISFTFGATSQYVYADLDVYTKCNASWGLVYDGFQLIIASTSTAVTFDIHIQMFQDETCTVVDGSQDVIIRSGEIAQFTSALQYESFVVSFKAAKFW
ncbi:hypothetical protein HDU84_000633 [Entophlyctis sp. JEL0112]|nr:hypothetical protein HDU84_000633 [Entophlyctis sp. JEL0112]